MDPEFLSGEASASPAVAALLAGAKRLDEAGHGVVALSARNGPRTTTHATMPAAMLSPQDFVEVADYDAHLDRLLCIGRREPHAHAGMHHLMLRAKKEIGAIVMVDGVGGGAGEGAGEGAGSRDLPLATRGRTQLENAMAALEALRGRDACLLGRFLVATGRTPEEAIDRAVRLL